MTNDRPAVLFRTLGQLVEQTRPECVTVHVDGVNDLHATEDQRATLRVVRWCVLLKSKQGISAPPSFLPSFPPSLPLSRHSPLPPSPPPPPSLLPLISLSAVSAYSPGRGRVHPSIFFAQIIY